MWVRIRIALAMLSCISAITAAPSVWGQQTVPQVVLQIQTQQTQHPQTQQQQNAPLAPGSSTPDVIPQPPSRRIFLDVVVNAKKGPPIAGLLQQNFTLLDNNVPQPITSFKSMSGTQTGGMSGTQTGQEPIEVIILLDGINASTQTVSFAREQIDKFLRANGGHLLYPTAIPILTDTGSKMQENFSTDGNALSASLDQIAIPPSRFERLDQPYSHDSEAFLLSLKALRLLATRESTRPGRKIVLWVSPGWPLLTNPRVELPQKDRERLFTGIVELSNALRQARITLYSVNPLGDTQDTLRTALYQAYEKGVTKPARVEAGHLNLQVLATQSGGLALYAGNDVAAFLQQCIADTQAYYEISFDPPPAEHRDEYHHLEIRLAQPGLTARTRQGYYAQP